MINDIIFAQLFSESELLKGETKFPAKRDLFSKIKDNVGKLTGIYGLRGVGKTTLLLQIAKEKENSIYINVEKLIFKDISVVDFVEFARNKGFSSFFLDEIHSYPNWARELKILYDDQIRNIYFSGSSSIKIQELGADLSRRALLYNLLPLSFREFLEISLNKKFDIISFEELIDYKKRKELISNIAPYISHFEEYAKFGSFPFYINEKQDAYETYNRIIQKIVRVDLASIEKIDINYIDNVFKIINTIAISNPSEINFHSLSNSIRKNEYIVEETLRVLSDIGFVNAIRPYKKGKALIRKEYKYLVSPPFRLTLAKSLGFGFDQVKGGIREDLFVANTKFLDPKYVKTDRERKTPDYRINDLTFEIGPHKYKHETDYYVKDGLIIEDNVIPLPLFCMLY